MPPARPTSIILIALLGVIARAPCLAAAPAAPPTHDDMAAPAERPLDAVFDAARGRVTINRARGVQFDKVRGGPQISFTMVNSTREERPVRIGFLHLPEGDYEVYTSSPAGSGTKLDNNHLAAGWRFVLPVPQTETSFGAQVRWLTDRLNRTRLLLADRAEAQFNKALAPLAAAVARARADLAATRRTDVLVVPSATRFIQAPVKSHMLSAEQMSRRQQELEQRRRFLIAASEYLSDRAIASRIQLWFTPRRPHDTPPTRKNEKKKQL